MISTRRGWLSGCASLAIWSEVAAAREHARQALRTGQRGSFETLDPAMAADIEALTSQIIPSIDGRGAREAGAVYFIDRALSTFDRDERETYRIGMAMTASKRLELFPQSRSIAALNSSHQIELIRAIEHTDFFELLRTHTVLGFLGNPSYGGNRDGVGWRSIGFEDRMGFEPPFGYYDAQAAGDPE